MTDTAYTLYRLSVALAMPDGRARNIVVAGILYRLAMITEVNKCA